KAKHLFSDIYLVQTSDAMKLQSELKDNQDVIYTEKNYYSGAKELPKAQEVFEIEGIFSRGDSLFNDPDISKVWAFKDANEEGISVNKAYANPLNRTQTDIIVAVVDTGVDYNHEELKSVMWHNPNEIPNNGID